jgi:hypothetical protein
MTAETPKDTFPNFSLPKKIPIPIANMIEIKDWVTFGFFMGKSNVSSQSSIFIFLTK